MSEVSVIEQELLDATKYKGKKGASREDYLAGLVKAVEKLDEDDFDSLSDTAADWYNSAVEAMNDKEPPPEFPDVEADDDADVEADDSEADGNTGGDPDDETDDADDSSEGDLDDDEDEDTDAAGEDEAEEEAPPPKKARGRSPKDTEKKDSPKPKIKPEPERYAKITGEKDRFGIVKGTKTSDAVAMYCRPQGATAAQIMEKLNGRYYNVTRRLAAEGHHVEKLEGGGFKIIHRDDYGKKVKSGGKKGK